VIHGIVPVSSAFSARMWGWDEASGSTTATIWGSIPDSNIVYASIYGSVPMSSSFGGFIDGYIATHPPQIISAQGMPAPAFINARLEPPNIDVITRESPTGFVKSNGPEVIPALSRKEEPSPIAVT
jgi:hypothetical protein